MSANIYHLPVLTKQVINYLITDKSGTYLDGTVGGGGHSSAILHALNQHGRLIGLDIDEEAIAFAKKRLISFGDHYELKRCNFSQLSECLPGQTVAGILLDLGLSSHQIDSVRRGFSYLHSGPLDMRMDLGQRLNAEKIINEYEVKALIDIFKRYGEERYAKPIALAINMEREKNRISNTEQLANIIRRIVPFRQAIKSLSRIFQSLRIEINRELDNLTQALQQSIPKLKVNGRLVVITYHSLEDRIVKHFFNEQENPCVCPPELPVCGCNKKSTVRILTKRSLQPDQKEIDANPRSRSARLRAVEKIA